MVGRQGADGRVTDYHVIADADQEATADDEWTFGVLFETCLHGDTTCFRVLPFCRPALTLVHLDAFLLVAFMMDDAPGMVSHDHTTHYTHTQPYEKHTRMIVSHIEQAQRISADCGCLVRTMN